MTASCAFVEKISRSHDNPETDDFDPFTAKGAGMGNLTLNQTELAPTANESQIQPEASYSLPKPASVDVADSGRVRFGAGYRLPADRQPG
jgi:hypothetical protein